MYASLRYIAWLDALAASTRQFSIYTNHVQIITMVKVKLLSVYVHIVHLQINTETPFSTK